MDFKRLSEQAKRLFDKRGGTKALKEDADELRDIARGEGSLSDKAKAAANAIKDPGAPGQSSPDAPGQPPPEAPEQSSPDAPGQPPPDAPEQSSPDSPGQPPPDAPDQSRPSETP